MENRLQGCNPRDTMQAEQLSHQAQYSAHFALSPEPKPKSTQYGGWREGGTANTSSTAPETWDTVQWQCFTAHNATLILCSTCCCSHILLILLETFSERATGSTSLLPNHDMQSEVQSMCKLKQFECATETHVYMQTCSNMPIGKKWPLVYG